MCRGFYALSFSLYPFKPIHFITSWNKNLLAFDERVSSGKLTFKEKVPEPSPSLIYWGHKKKKVKRPTLYFHLLRVDKTLKEPAPTQSSGEKPFFFLFFPITFFYTVYYHLGAKRCSDGHILLSHLLHNCKEYSATLDNDWIICHWCWMDLSCECTSLKQPARLWRNKLGKY